MSESNSSNRIYFPHLDVVRGISAFLVIFVHAYADYVNWFGRPDVLEKKGNELNIFGELAEQFIENLGITVDVFFLISGFLITYILVEEKKRFGKISIKNFIIRRSLRIWPLYFLILAITPIIVWSVDRPDPNYLMNLLFLSNFDVINQTIFPWPLAHFWTLSIEEHFYIFWPFMVAFLPKKYLLRSMAGIIAISLIFRIYSFYFVDNYQLVLYVHTLSRMDALAIGGIGAYFYSRRAFEFKLDRKIRLTLVVGLLALMCTSAIHEWLNLFDVIFKKYIYIAIISVLLLDFDFNPTFENFLGKKSFLHYLGKISYGIYMYGNIVVLFVTQRIMHNNKMDNIFLYFAFLIAITLIISSVSYEFFEKPLLKLKRKFSKIKTAH
jgi:peptidoglycan/LPS O-acetylase OafA/YrhL